MPTSPFTVTEHVVDAQYMREYPHATTTQDAPLKLAVKKYTPVNNENPQPGDVTLVGFHGAGFPKELYEPLWEDLLARCTQSGIRVRAIWMADAANQGASSTHNERYLGNDPAWMDHSRDMLLMMNQFREEMPQPIMGVGHSMGTTQLIFLSLMHPRLFTSLILIEPFFVPKIDANDSPLLILMTERKRDLWPSRQIAAEKYRKLFRHWDDRVLDRWVQYGYRDLPTALYPDAAAGAAIGEIQDKDTKPVTLTSTKHQELFLYTRPNLNQHGDLGLSGTAETSPPHDPLFYPDVLGDLPKGLKFYRYESILAWKLLPHVRPSVLYIGGGNAIMEKSGTLKKGAEATGTRWGGSGGMAYDRVRHVTILGAGHDVPFQREKIPEIAERMAEWMARGVERWGEDQRRIVAGWDGLEGREKAMFKKEWKKALYETATVGKSKTKARSKL
ncbi:Alpha/beta hydrolase family-domain-containing protein [Aspergillus karnatakaensis]|uniref:alpha/beta hydrolase n=1 Tax=Aspergillus karnatakaensis TaxID=1810916 RepID=UPI003CCD34D8